MQQKAELFATATPAMAADDLGCGRAIGDDEVEVAFLAEQRRRAQS
jgi:hypothetical protein